VHLWTCKQSLLITKGLRPASQQSGGWGLAQPM
jgi:hypothetical protein